MSPNILLDLWESCRIDGNIEDFKKALAKGQKLMPNAWEKCKRSFLFEALIKKDIDLVSLLIEQPGFDVNAKFDCDCDGVASTIGKRRFKRGQPCNSDNMCKANFSPVHIPLCSYPFHSEGSLEILKKLLATPGLDANAKVLGGPTANAKGFGGATPLMQAVLLGWIDCIKLLVDDDSVNLEFSRNVAIGPEVPKETITEIVKILVDAQRMRKRRQEKVELEKKKEERKAKNEKEARKSEIIEVVGLGKGRNARKRRNKEKQNRMNNEDKVDEAKNAADDKESESENVKMKLSLLEREEEEEKLKINLLLSNEREAFSNFADKIKIKELERVTLENEMKEIESALQALFQRKLSVVEKQKAVETKVTSIEKEQTILKENVAAQVDKLETKIVLIQNEMRTAKKSLEKAEGKKENVGNRELEIFLEGQILELEGELECPVCLEVATTSPIYKCIDDHLLCRF